MIAGRVTILEIFRKENLQFPNAAIPKFNAVDRVNTQLSAKERKRKSAKERKRALPLKICKQPGLKQPGLGTPKAHKLKKIDRPAVPRTPGDKQGSTDQCPGTSCCLLSKD